MATLLSRRTFVKGAAGLVAFAGVFRYLTVDRVSEALTEQLPDDIPPVPDDVPLVKFLKGSVVSLTGSGFIAHTVGGRRTVELEGARVWKKDVIPSIPIEEGDAFVAWGDPQDDGTYVAEKIWFNLFNVVGVVSNLRDGATQATFDLSGGRYDASIRADASAILDTGDAEEAFDPSNVPFTDGEGVHVVGIRTADGLIATRIIV